MPSSKEKRAEQQRLRREAPRAVGASNEAPEGMKPRESEAPVEAPDVTPDGRPIHVMRWTDADGVAQVTRYCGPLPDWKGLGYCRDCNQAVMSGSNYCGCKVLV